MGRQRDGGNCGGPTTSVHILGYEARVTAPDEISRTLPEIFSTRPPWAGVGGPADTNWFSVESGLDGAFRLKNGELCMVEVGDLADVVHLLDAAIMAAAAECLAKEYLLFHAGSVARNGTGLLLPAATGGGKTTLVAGLLSAGWSYYGDELAVMDPSSHELLPVNRSMCVRSGSCAVLQPRYPALVSQPTYRRYGEEKIWYLRPPHPALPVAPAPVRLVVLPSYEAGAPTTLSPISRSAAMQALLEQSFLASTGTSERIEALVQMLRQASCFALRSGNLDEATAQLSQLVA